MALSQEQFQALVESIRGVVKDEISTEFVKFREKFNLELDAKIGAKVDEATQPLIDSIVALESVHCHFEPVVAGPVRGFAHSEFFFG